MSDTGSERPLSRRERRLLEMQQQAEQQAERTAPDPEDEVIWEPVQEETILPEASDALPVEVAEGVFIEIDESLLEVPTVDEAGNALSRREIRQLRQAAIDKIREQKIAELQEQGVIPEPEVQQASEDLSEDEVSPEDASGSAPDQSDLADLIDAPVATEDLPTQALSLEDIREIEQDAEQAEQDAIAESVAVEDLSDIIDALDEEVEVAEETDLSSVIPEESLPDVIEESEGEEQSEPQSQPEPEIEESTDLDEPVAASDSEGYTFPDIKPLEEERPVFDDPSVRTVGSPSTGFGTGFEDMIERAVADETASVHNGSSSLILPTIPGTDEFSGPIGTTGELFVTGSFELPKSIGETGGHARLQDSVEDDEQDPVDMLGLTDVYETSEFDSAPVAASQAVSTKSLDKTGITTPEVQRDNKKSLILMGTGGGLILVLIAAGVWAVNSGLFG